MTPRTRRCWRSSHRWSNQGLPDLEIDISLRPRPIARLVVKTNAPGTTIETPGVGIHLAHRLLLTTRGGQCILLALAPEANHRPRAFRQTVLDAHQRIREIDRESADDVCN